VASFRDFVSALLGVSTFQPSESEIPGNKLTGGLVDRVRKAIGGQLEPLPITKLHWYLPDLEAAQAQADRGDMQMIGMLGQSMRRDGVLRGLLDVRSSVTSLPRRFHGGSTDTGREIIESLQSKNGSDRSVFDEMFPTNELSRFCEDGLVCGVGVAEMVPVQGRNFPVMVRRLPQNVWYLWQKNQWFYRSIAGLIPIVPGMPDESGHAWLLYTPGGRVTPWNYGLWPALGRSFISKEHSFYARQNYIAKLANPARVAEVPIGAGEVQKQGFLRDIIAWGLNTVFELPVGWSVKLLESNGRGFEVMQADIDTCNKEYATALCGNTVMMDGGVGFQNADIFRLMSENLIRQTAESLAHVLNTQGLPWYIASKWGVDALANAVSVEYDTTPPQDKKVQADTFVSLGSGIKAMVEAFALMNRTVNVDEIAARFGIPLNEQNPALMAGSQDPPRLVSVPAGGTEAPAAEKKPSGPANGRGFGKPETTSSDPLAGEEDEAA
jgi:hypothetical protein